MPKTKRLIIAKDNIKTEKGEIITGSIMLLETIENKTKILLRGVTNYSTHNSNEINDNYIDVYKSMSKDHDVYFKHFSIWSMLKMKFKKAIGYETVYDKIEKSVLVDDDYISKYALTVFTMLVEVGVVKFGDYAMMHDEYDDYNLHGDFTFKKLSFLKWFYNTVHSS